MTDIQTTLQQVCLNVAVCRLKGYWKKIKLNILCSLRGSWEVENVGRYFGEENCWFTSDRPKKWTWEAWSWKDWRQVSFSRETEKGACFTYGMRTHAVIFRLHGRKYKHIEALVKSGSADVRICGCYASVKARLWITLRLGLGMRLEYG